MSDEAPVGADERIWLDGLLRSHDQHFGTGISIRKTGRAKVEPKDHKVSRCFYCLQYFTGDYEYCSRECYIREDNERRAIERINYPKPPATTEELNEMFEGSLRRNKGWSQYIAD